MDDLYEKQVRYLMESEKIEYISCSLPRNMETILIQCLKKSNKVILLCKNVEEFGFNMKIIPFVTNAICYREIDFKILTKESFSISKVSKAKSDLRILSRLHPDNIRIYNLRKDFKIDGEYFFSADNDRFFIVKTSEYSKAFFNYSRHKEINDITNQILGLEKTLNLRRFR